MKRQRPINEQDNDRLRSPAPWVVRRKVDEDYKQDQHKAQEEIVQDGTSEELRVFESINTSVPSFTNSPSASARMSTSTSPALEIRDTTTATGDYKESESKKQRILRLQEIVRLEEQVLQHLIQRRSEIQKDIEAERAKQLQFQEEQNNLTRRRQQLLQSRLKHLTLQKELRESLAKSKDRLDSLTSLEKQPPEQLLPETVVEVSSQLENSTRKIENESEVSLNTSIDETEIMSDISMVKRPLDKKGEDYLSSDKETKELGQDSLSKDKDESDTDGTMLISAPISLTAVSEDYLYDILRCHPPSVSRSGENQIYHPFFLPMMQRNTLKRICNISIRESKALSKEEAIFRSKGDSSISHYIGLSRRCFLWNTCLDFLCLSPPSFLQVAKDQNNKYAEEEPMDLVPDQNDQDFRLNPNLSLCPYELSGVCADGFCPYQHISFRPAASSPSKSAYSTEMAISREQLPLPNLHLSQPASKKKPMNILDTVSHKMSLVINKSDYVQTNDTTLNAGTNHNQILGEETIEKERMDRQEDNFDDNSAVSDSYDPNLPSTRIDCALDEKSTTANDEDFIALPQSMDEDDNDGGRDADDDCDENENSPKEETLISAYLNGSITNLQYSNNKEPKARSIASKNWMFWWREYNVGSTPSSVENLLKEFGEIRIEKDEKAPGGRQMAEKTRLVLAISRISNQQPKLLGRLVDMFRIAIHSGRFDLSHSLLTLAAQCSSQDDHLSYVPVIEMIRKLERMALTAAIDQGTSWVFKNFSIQASLSMLSEYLSSADDLLYYPDSHSFESQDGRRQEDGGQESQNFISLQEIVLSCIEQMINETEKPGNQSSSLSKGKNADDLLKEFNIILEDLSVELTDKTKASPDEYDSKRLHFENLYNALDWIKLNLKTVVGTPMNLHSIEDQILKPCWSLVQKFLHYRNHESKDDQEKSKYETQHYWNCSSAVILMGFIILECLNRFASEVSYGVDEVSNPSFNASLTSIDGSIHDILKSLSQQICKRYQMLDLLVTPILSANIATSAYLRQYSAAQNRLTASILPPAIIGSTTTVKFSSSVTQSDVPSLRNYSELLWSQFIQLRMSLPTEESQAVDNWQIPQKARDELKLLLDMIESYGLRLHHISFEGDRNLFSCGNSTFSNGSNSESHPFLSVLKMIAASIEGDPQGSNVEKKQVLGSIELRDSFLHHCDTRGRGYSPLISTIPRSILLMGSSLNVLQLENCNLSCLPPFFARYFPNLTSLNLSRNKIQNLPKMMKSMKSLELLNICHNRLVNLKKENLNADLKYLYVTHNCLVSVPSSLSKICPKLVDLRLSQNYFPLRQVVTSVAAAGVVVVSNGNETDTCTSSTTYSPLKNKNAHDTAHLSSSGSSSNSISGIVSQSHFLDDDVATWILEMRDLERCDWKPQRQRHERLL